MSALLPRLALRGAACVLRGPAPAASEAADDGEDDDASDDDENGDARGEGVRSAASPELAAPFGAPRALRKP